MTTRTPRFHRNGGIVFQRDGYEVWLWADRTLWWRPNDHTAWDLVPFGMPAALQDVLVASVEAGIHALALSDDHAPFSEGGTSYDG